MNFTIDLEQKAPGYKEALLELVNSPHAVQHGILCELGPIHCDDFTKRQMKTRMSIIDRKRVCAKLTATEIVDNKVTFTVEPTGPLRKSFENLFKGGTSFQPVARASFTPEGEIINMFNIDLNPIYE